MSIPCISTQEKQRSPWLIKSVCMGMRQGQFIGLLKKKKSLNMLISGLQKKKM